MTAYFLFNTTQLKWQIFYAECLLWYIYQVQNQIRDTYKQIQ